MFHRGWGMSFGGRLAVRRLSRLTLVKVALALYLVGMFVTGKKPALWPIVNWPMYSGREFSYPSDTTSVMEVGVVTTDTKTTIIPMSKLVTTGREIALVPIIKCAVGLEWEKRGWEKAPTAPEHCRDYLRELVVLRLPDTEIIHVEIWRVDWAVEPLALHPVNRNAPLRRVLLGRFDVKTSDQGGAER